MRSQLSYGTGGGFDSLSLASQILISTDLRICWELPCSLIFLNGLFPWQFMSLQSVEDGFFYTLSSIFLILAGCAAILVNREPWASSSVCPVGVTLWKQARWERWARNPLQTS